MQVLGVDQIATFKREDINAMLVRHLRHFRKDPMFARAAIVLAIEANYSYVESRDVANLLSVPELQPVVTLCEDNQNLGKRAQQCVVNTHRTAGRAHHRV